MSAESLERQPGFPTPGCMVTSSIHVLEAVHPGKVQVTFGRLMAHDNTLLSLADNGMTEQSIEWQVRRKSGSRDFFSSSIHGRLGAAYGLRPGRSSLPWGVLRLWVVTVHDLDAYVA